MPAPYVALRVDSSFPAGGVLRGEVVRVGENCQPSCGALFPRFADVDGVAVPGRFLDGPDAAFVFVPNSPIEPGTYTATVSGPYNYDSQQFTVVDAPFELPTFTSSVDTETVSEGELIRCEELGEDSLTNWFTAQTRVRPTVTVTLTGFYARQFGYSLGLPGEVASPSSRMPLQRSFEVDTDELCFEVIGYSFQDDSITEIGQECVSLAGLGVGVKDEMSGNFRQTLLGCVVPPAGYEEDWCQFFERALTSGSCDGFTLDACFAARRACPAGDAPSTAQEQDERAARQPTATNDGGGAPTNTGSAGGQDDAASGGSSAEPDAPASGGSSAGPGAPGNTGREGGQNDAASGGSSAGPGAPSNTGREDGQDAAASGGIDAPLSAVRDGDGNAEGTSEKTRGCSLGPARSKGSSNWFVLGLPLLILAGRRRDRASRIQ